MSQIEVAAPSVVLPEKSAAPFAGKTACFYVKTNNPTILEQNEFYRVDIQILQELGFEVKVCTDLLRIPKADLYLVWWWTWALAPLLRARLAGSPVVIVGSFDHVMPDGSFQIYPTRPKYHQALIRWALRAASANIVCAEDQAAKIRASFAVTNLNVVPHVLDTSTYAPTGAPREPFFVTLCWMHEDNAIRKCVATSIRAMALLRERLPNHRLIVSGYKGGGYPALEALVNELDAWEFVEFPGLVSVEDKVSLLQRCTAYLQPTLAEGFGVAILEGMSCGAPVITSPVGAVPSVVDDCALFVDGTDPEALAEHMYRIATERELAEDLSLRGRQRAVDCFSYDRRYRDFHRVIAGAMA